VYFKSKCLINQGKIFFSNYISAKGIALERGLINLKDLIMGDRVFQIPIYQRHYAWQQSQLEDLWNDLYYLDIDKKHYFGTILLKDTGRSKKFGLRSFRIFEIIDGQQRMTTVLILLKEILRELKNLVGADIKEEELDEIEKSYLKYKEVYKLELLGDDAEFFHRYVIEDNEYPDEILTPSQRRLKNAKLFFRKKLNEVKNVLRPHEFKDFLVQLKQKIDNLELIRYEVQNESDAVLIFETVNDRGKPLSRLEKTKSFLMHMIYLSEPEDVDPYLRRINESFYKIFRYIEEIKNTDYGANLDEESIQRYHFIIYETEAKGDRDTSYNYLDFLKKRVRKLYRENKKNCLNYTLNYALDLERAFYALKEILTYEHYDEIGALLKRLFILERVANFYPLLIATWIRFKNIKDRLKSLLRIIEVFAFRVYAIGRRRADTGEAALSRLAYKVYRENLDFDELIKELKKLILYYEDDGFFESDLKDENFYKRIANRDIKYLFFEYERYLRQSAKEPLDIKIDKVLSQEFEIEHIWPRDAKGLPDYLKEIHEKYKDKLGNLTIASKSWNARWGKKPFNVKKAGYACSLLRVQRELSSCPDWGKDQIEDREKRIVNFALQRWKI